MLNSKSKIKKWVIGFVSLAIIGSSLLSYFFKSNCSIYAEILNSPVTKSLPNISPSFSKQPVDLSLMRGVKIDPNNPLNLSFYFSLDNKNKTNNQDLHRLIKYFFGFLALPDDKLWVNLSPYEEHRIIPEELNQLDIGKTLLIEDFFLKQLTCALTNPSTSQGKRFWQEVNKLTVSIAQSRKATVGSFNKVWIIPDSAVINESKKGVFIKQAKLKVMIEDDYFSLAKDKSKINSGNKQVKQIFKQQILPIIENEVNNSLSFAGLRQLYYCYILSSYLKGKLKNQNVYNSYIDRGKFEPITIADNKFKKFVYNEYVDNFTKGKYNAIETTYDQLRKRKVIRRYFSGGVVLNRPVLTSDNDSPSGSYQELKVKGREVKAAKLVGSTLTKAEIDPLAGKDINIKGQEIFFKEQLKIKVKQIKDKIQGFNQENLLLLAYSDARLSLNKIIQKLIQIEGADNLGVDTNQYLKEGYLKEVMGVFTNYHYILADKLSDKYAEILANCQVIDFSQLPEEIRKLSLYVYPHTDNKGKTRLFINKTYWDSIGQEDQAEVLLSLIAHELSEGLIKQNGKNISGIALPHSGAFFLEVLIRIILTDGQSAIPLRVLKQQDIDTLSQQEYKYTDDPKVSPNIEKGVKMLAQGFARYLKANLKIEKEEYRKNHPTAQDLARIQAEKEALALTQKQAQEEQARLAHLIQEEKLAREKKNEEEEDKACQEALSGKGIEEALNNEKLQKKAKRELAKAKKIQVEKEQEQKQLENNIPSLEDNLQNCTQELNKVISENQQRQNQKKVIEEKVDSLVRQLTQLQEMVTKAQRQVEQQKQYDKNKEVLINIIGKDINNIVNSNATYKKLILKGMEEAFLIAEIKDKLASAIIDNLIVGKKEINEETMRDELFSEFLSKALNMRIGNILEDILKNRLINEGQEKYNQAQKRVNDLQEGLVKREGEIRDLQLRIEKEKQGEDNKNRIRQRVEKNISSLVKRNRFFLRLRASIRQESILSEVINHIMDQYKAEFIDEDTVCNKMTDGQFLEKIQDDIDVIMTKMLDYKNINEHKIKDSQETLKELQAQDNLLKQQIQQAQEDLAMAKKVKEDNSQKQETESKTKIKVQEEILAEAKQEWKSVNNLVLAAKEELKIVEDSIKNSEKELAARNAAERTVMGNLILAKAAIEHIKEELAIAKQDVVEKEKKLADVLTNIRASNEQLSPESKQIIGWLQEQDFLITDIFEKEELNLGSADIQRVFQDNMQNVLDDLRLKNNIFYFKNILDKEIKQLDQALSEPVKKEAIKQRYKEILKRQLKFLQEIFKERNINKYNDPRDSKAYEESGWDKDSINYFFTLLKSDRANMFLIELIYYFRQFSGVGRTIKALVPITINFSALADVEAFYLNNKERISQDIRDWEEYFKAKKGNSTKPEEISFYEELIRQKELLLLAVENDNDIDIKFFLDSMLKKIDSDRNREKEFIAKFQEIAQESQNIHLNSRIAELYATWYGLEKEAKGCSFDKIRDNMFLSLEILAANKIFPVAEFDFLVSGQINNYIIEIKNYIGKEISGGVNFRTGRLETREDKLIGILSGVIGKKVNQIDKCLYYRSLEKRISTKGQLIKDPTKLYIMIPRDILLDIDPNNLVRKIKANVVANKPQTQNLLNSMGITVEFIFFDYGKMDNMLIADSDSAKEFPWNQVPKLAGETVHIYDKAGNLEFLLSVLRDELPVQPKSIDLGQESTGTLKDTANNGGIDLNRKYLKLKLENSLEKNNTDLVAIEKNNYFYNQDLEGLAYKVVSNELVKI